MSECPYILCRAVGCLKATDFIITVSATVRICSRILSASQKRKFEIIKRLPCALSEKEIKALGRLIGTQVVRECDLRKVPTSLQEACFCKSCVANDFIIPGLEFDSDGLCPMCSSRDKTKDLRSILPIVDKIPHTDNSQFDVALFYTGGKDSTFLLYYLAKKCGLRVLAMTWDMPFMSDSAKASIENAKRAFDNVEFISRAVGDEDMKKINGMDIFGFSGLNPDLVNF